MKQAIPDFNVYVNVWKRDEIARFVIGSHMVSYTAILQWLIIVLTYQYEYKQ